jgi:hypothetical protein
MSSAFVTGCCECDDTQAPASDVHNSNIEQRQLRSSGTAECTLLTHAKLYHDEADQDEANDDMS